MIVDPKKPNEMLDSIDKSEFERLKRDEKMHDKKFETKPIGYFKDAMIRFGKNRTNVIATIILGILIFLAISVPIFTTKNFTRQETQLAYLPPRLPILENFGISDGTRYIEGRTVNRDTIDPETGLGYPLTADFDPQYIVMDTLTNRTISCTIRDERCVGGTVSLALEGTNQYVVRGHTEHDFDPDTNPYVEIDLEFLTAAPNTSVNIYVLANNVRLDIGSADGIGPDRFDVYNDDHGFDETFTSLIYLELSSDDTRARTVLNSFAIYDDTDDEAIHYDSGYTLSIYTTQSGSGRISRSGGELLQASFEYDAYGAAFGENRTTMGRNEMMSIIEANPDVCPTPDPALGDDRWDGWEFDEGCPITRVINESSRVERDGVIYANYDLYVNYQIYSGYDDIPYFFFGTTASGADLFAQTWLGLRTSLSIGLVVALINITIGIVYGSISGYYGGKVDLLMERFSELVGRIPWLVTLSIFITLVGPGALALILILIVSGWIGIASVTRTQFYRYKGREYVLASRTLGAKDSRLIFRHILPNGVGTIITASVLSIPLVIFTEAALSYLGFGIGHGQSFKFFGLIELSGVSIGVLLADGRTQMLSRPYLTLYPAIIISILMITFNMFGNALRDAFNPSLRGSN